MPLAEVCRIGVVLAKGLHSLHEAGITHLDVKPANVLLDLHDDPVLTDFSISSTASNTLICQTTAGSQGPLGTPQYLCAQHSCSNA